MADFDFGDGGESRLVQRVLSLGGEARQESGAAGLDGDLAREELDGGGEVVGILAGAWFGRGRGDALLMMAQLSEGKRKGRGAYVCENIQVSCFVVPYFLQSIHGVVRKPQLREILESEVVDCILVEGYNAPFGV